MKMLSLVETGCAICVTGPLCHRAVVSQGLCVIGPLCHRVRVRVRLEVGLGLGDPPIKSIN